MSDEREFLMEQLCTTAHSIFEACPSGKMHAVPDELPVTNVTVGQLVKLLEAYRKRRKRKAARGRDGRSRS